MPLLPDKRLKAAYDTWWSVKIAALGKFVTLIRLPTDNLDGAGETYLTFGPSAAIVAKATTPTMTLLPDPYGGQRVQFGPPMLRSTGRALRAKGYRLVIIDEPIWKG